MKIRSLLFAFGICVFLASCSKEDDSVQLMLNSSGLDQESIELKLGESLKIAPKLNTDDVDNLWKVNDQEVSRESSYNFQPAKVGEYRIEFTASNESGSVECKYTILVIQLREVTDETSAYLFRLFEYKPAPGQFVNEGFGKLEDAQSILGKPKYGLVTLGGFGGYISLGFDHTIVDTEGEDIIVYGNAFEGSSEPGIVMVSFDYNGNGEADDAWYELAGSEYHAEKTIHNYEITYTNPKGYADVPWTDNQGNSGVVKINDWHRHNYYPEFIHEQESVTFTGTLLENKTDLEYTHPNYGTIVWNPAREWGYVDNYSEEYDELKGNKFDISWAVNEEGKPVKLPGVDFIKIYTATNVNGGWLGENSTEIMGAADLELLEN